MEHYRVTVDVTVRVIVDTRAKSFDEAYDNALNDYDNSSIGDFITQNWDAEGLSITEVDCEIIEKESP